MTSRRARNAKGGATADTNGGGMIANDLQYRVTRAAAREFEEGLARLDEAEAHRSPEMRALMRVAMESQLEDLRQQLAKYEALRVGRVRVLEVDSLEELPDALIRARIAGGLTQKELARRLGMRESQLQRYEATRYAGASLARLQAVADALGVQTRSRVVLPTAGDR
ncbi:MAG TPA: helix-turn-helix transcriptional regulator [Chloroflexota bacterium]|jgi:DNA-binding Xre family transcriptional regulator|nr:helix-turn-helix transcriptional regulator [Chloroflexota bacterium]